MVLLTGSAAADDSPCERGTDHHSVKHTTPDVTRPPSADGDSASSGSVLYNIGNSSTSANCVSNSSEIIPSVSGGFKSCSENCIINSVDDRECAERDSGLKQQYVYKNEFVQMENVNKLSIMCSLPLDKIEDILNVLIDKDPIIRMRYRNVSPNQDDSVSCCVDVDVSKVKKSRLLCLYCDRTFLTTTLKQKHIERYHSVSVARRSSARTPNQNQGTACMYCGKHDDIGNDLKKLFEHLATEHSSKYHGCVICEERFRSKHNFKTHNVKVHGFIDDSSLDDSQLSNRTDASEIDDKGTNHNDSSTSSVTTDYSFDFGKALVTVMSTVDLKSDLETVENETDKKQNTKKFKCVPRTRPTCSNKTSKNNKRVTRSSSANNQNNPKSKSKQTKTSMENDENTSDKSHDSNETSVKDAPVKSEQGNDSEPVPVAYEFDENFFTCVSFNICDNLMNHLDGKLSPKTDSIPNEINLSKNNVTNNVKQNQETSNSEHNLALTAVTPITTLLTSQSGIDSYKQTEYGTKAPKEAVRRHFVKYHFRSRKQKNSEYDLPKDISKLDMWTQIAMKCRQQKVKNNSGKNGSDDTGVRKAELQVEELNRILDTRGPFQDLHEEALNSAHEINNENYNEEEIKNNVSVNNCNKSLNETDSQLTSSTEQIINDRLQDKDDKKCVKTDNSDSETYQIITRSRLSKAEELEETLNYSTDETTYSQIPNYLNLTRTSERQNDQTVNESLLKLGVNSSVIEKYLSGVDQGAIVHSTVEMSGEWARPRLYICAVCGIKLPNLRQLEDHKSLTHPYVWCMHYEFVGKQSELYPHLNIPGLGRLLEVEQNIKSSTPASGGSSNGNAWVRSPARTCSKCGKQCNALGDLHRHMLECGGDLTWMLARKKCKYRPYGAKSRRRRKGVKRNNTNHKQPAGGAERRRERVKMAVIGPRPPRPSDAESIERMLANLPAKRATRKILCLKEGGTRQPRQKPATIIENINPNNNSDLHLKHKNKEYKFKSARLRKLNNKKDQITSSLKAANKILNNKIKHELQRNLRNKNNTAKNQKQETSKDADLSDCESKLLRLHLKNIEQANISASGKSIVKEKKKSKSILGRVLGSKIIDLNSKEGPKTRSLQTLNKVNKNIANILHRKTRSAMQLSNVKENKNNAVNKKMKAEESKRSSLRSSRSTLSVSNSDIASSSVDNEDGNNEKSNKKMQSIKKKIMTNKTISIFKKKLRSQTGSYNLNADGKNTSVGKEIVAKDSNTVRQTSLRRSRSFNDDQSIGQLEKTAVKKKRIKSMKLQHAISVDGLLSFDSVSSDSTGTLLKVSKTDETEDIDVTDESSLPSIKSNKPKISFKSLRKNIHGFKNKFVKKKRTNELKPQSKSAVQKTNVEEIENLNNVENKLSKTFVPVKNKRKSNKKIVKNDVAAEKKFLDNDIKACLSKEISSTSDAMQLLKLNNADEHNQSASGSERDNKNSNIVDTSSSEVNKSILDYSIMPVLEKMESINPIQTSPKEISPSNIPVLSPAVIEIKNLNPLIIPNFSCVRNLSNDLNMLNSNSQNGIYKPPVSFMDDLDNEVLDLTVNKLSINTSSNQVSSTTEHKDLLHSEQKIEDKSKTKGFKKPIRRLNDCIAMLTCKLQQKLLSSNVMTSEQTEPKEVISECNSESLQTCNMNNICEQEKPEIHLDSSVDSDEKYCDAPVQFVNEKLNTEDYKTLNERVNCDDKEKSILTTNCESDKSQNLDITENYKNIVVMEELTNISDKPIFNIKETVISHVSDIENVSDKQSTEILNVEINNSFKKQEDVLPDSAILNLKEIIINDLPENNSEHQLEVKQIADVDNDNIDTVKNNTKKSRPKKMTRRKIGSIRSRRKKLTIESDSIKNVNENSVKENISLNEAFIENSKNLINETDGIIKPDISIDSIFSTLEKVIDNDSKNNVNIDNIENMSESSTEDIPLSKLKINNRNKTYLKNKYTTNTRKLCSKIQEKKKKKPSSLKAIKQSIFTSHIEFETEKTKNIVQTKELLQVSNENKTAEVKSINNEVVSRNDISELSLSFDNSSEVVENFNLESNLLDSKMLPKKSRQTKKKTNKQIQPAAAMNELNNVQNELQVTENVNDIIRETLISTGPVSKRTQNKENNNKIGKSKRGKYIRINRKKVIDRLDVPSIYTSDDTDLQINNVKYTTENTPPNDLKSTENIAELPEKEKKYRRNNKKVQTAINADVIEIPLQSSTSKDASFEIAKSLDVLNSSEKAVENINILCNYTLDDTDLQTNNAKCSTEITLTDDLKSTENITELSEKRKYRRNNKKIKSVNTDLIEIPLESSTSNVSFKITKSLDVLNSSEKVVENIDVLSNYTSDDTGLQTNNAKCSTEITLTDDLKSTENITELPEKRKYRRNNKKIKSVNTDLIEIPLESSTSNVSVETTKSLNVLNFSEKVVENIDVLSHYTSDDTALQTNNVKCSTEITLTNDLKSTENITELPEKRKYKKSNKKVKSINNADIPETFLQSSTSNDVSFEIAKTLDVLNSSENVIEKIDVPSINTSDLQTYNVKDSTEITSPNGLKSTENIVELPEKRKYRRNNKKVKTAVNADITEVHLQSSTSNVAFEIAKSLDLSISDENNLETNLLEEFNSNKTDDVLFEIGLINEIQTSIDKNVLNKNIDKKTLDFNKTNANSTEEKELEESFDIIEDISLENPEPSKLPDSNIKNKRNYKRGKNKKSSIINSQPQKKINTKQNLVSVEPKNVISEEVKANYEKTIEEVATEIPTSNENKTTLEKKKIIKTKRNARTKTKEINIPDSEIPVHNDVSTCESNDTLNFVSDILDDNILLYKSIIEECKENNYPKPNEISRSEPEFNSLEVVKELSQLTNLIYNNKGDEIERTVPVENQFHDNSKTENTTNVDEISLDVEQNKNAETKLFDLKRLSSISDSEDEIPLSLLVPKGIENIAESNDMIKIVDDIVNIDLPTTDSTIKNLIEVIEKQTPIEISSNSIEPKLAPLSFPKVTNRRKKRSSKKKVQRKYKPKAFEIDKSSEPLEEDDISESSFINNTNLEISDTLNEINKAVSQNKDDIDSILETHIENIVEKKNDTEINTDLDEILKPLEVSEISYDTETPSEVSDLEKSIDTSVGTNSETESLISTKKKPVKRKLKNSRQVVKNVKPNVSKPPLDISVDHYCDICNKHFRRADNLTKHKMTFTHIAKLSEIEAKEAELKRQQEKLNSSNNIEVVNLPEEAVPENLNTPVSEREIIINEETTPEEEAVCEKEDNTETENDTTVSNVENIYVTTCNENEQDVENVTEKEEIDNIFNHKDDFESNVQKLLKEYVPDQSDDDISLETFKFGSGVNYPDLVTSNQPKRYRSLGERKSFDSNPSLLSPTRSNDDFLIYASNAIESQNQNTAYDEENEVSLPENFTYSEKTAEQCTLPESSKTVEQQFSNALEDNYSRKKLNRDEELFLECCTLLKSSSEVRNRKKTSSHNNFHLSEPKAIFPEVPINETSSENRFDSWSTSNSDWIMFKNNYNSNTSFSGALNENSFNDDEINKEVSINEHKDTFSNSKKSYTDDISVSSTSLSRYKYFGNHSDDSEDISESQNKEFSLESLENENISIGTKNRTILSKMSSALEQIFENAVEKRENEQTSFIKPQLQIITDDAQNTNTSSEYNDSKKFLTKGAMKVFEGIKVSIPTHELDLSQVLNRGNKDNADDLESDDPKTNSSKKSTSEIGLKLYKNGVEVSQSILKIPKSTSQVLSETENKLPRKPVVRRKKTSVLKSFGNKLGFRETKRKRIAKAKILKNNSKSNKDNSQAKDIYDFEESQDDSELTLFDPKSKLPFFKSFRSSQTDKDKPNETLIEPYSATLNVLAEPENNDSDSEPHPYIDSLSVDEDSSTDVTNDVCLVKTIKKKDIKKKPVKNGNQKKCMIMGRIFKHAVKNKLSDTDDAQKNPKHSINTASIQENIPKWSEKEIDSIFDALLGKDPTDSKKNTVEKKSNQEVIPNKPINESPPDSVEVPKIEEATPAKSNKKVKRARKNSLSDSDDEYVISSRKPTNSVKRKRSTKKQDCLNLEQELRECIGVAGRKSQRKCTSGKQNVLVEFWSSDESTSDIETDKKKKVENKSIQVINEIPTNENDFQKPEAIPEINEISDVVTPQTEIISEQDIIEDKVYNIENVSTEYENKDDLQTFFDSQVEIQSDKKLCKKARPINKMNKQKRIKSKNMKSNVKCTEAQENNKSCQIAVGLAATRRKRSASEKLYYWSSSSEDELDDLIEVQPIRDEFEDDRPIQHGWIVGDSPKKLVTLLAHAKGKKFDAECVKEQGKRNRTVS